MMQIDNAVSFITNTLKGIFNENYTDVQKVRLYYHYMESVLISLLNAKRLRLLESDYLTALNKMTELGLLSADIPIFYNEHRMLIEKRSAI